MIKKGSAGGIARGILERKLALEKYYEKPNICKQCNKVINIGELQKASEVKKKKFCNAVCSALFNNPRRLRIKKIVGNKTVYVKKKNCFMCNEEFETKSDKACCSKECSDKKRAQTISDPAIRKIFRDTRRKQLEIEESVANRLRKDGWEIFSPTVVCDRVGIKEGKVYFLEFKPEKDISLRSGQKRVSELVPNMYRIIIQ